MSKGRARPERKHRFIHFVLAWILPLSLLPLVAVFEHGKGWGRLPAETVHKTAVVAYIILFSILVFRVVCNVILDQIIVRYQGRPAPRIAKTLIGTFIAVLAMMFAANILIAGSINQLVTLSGVLGIVLGFALKPIILDIFSGISTNLDSAFQIGDWIEMGNRPGHGAGYAGWVEEINWRTTHIRLRTGDLVICPNSEVATAMIINFSRPWPLSRSDLPIKLPQRLDPFRAVQILQTAADATVGVEGGPSAERPPVVQIDNFTDSAVIYAIRFWIDRSKQSTDTAKHIVYSSILRHLQLAGIPLAEPSVINREGSEILDSRLRSSAAEALSKVEIFRGMEQVLIERLSTSVSTRGFRSGEILVEEGAEGTEMFIIMEGSVEISSLVNGVKIPVARLHAGEYFGEMSLLTGERRAATVTALSDGRLFCISRDRMADLLAADESLMELISRNVDERNQNRNALMTAAKAGPGNGIKSSVSSKILQKMKDVFGSRR